MTEAQRKLLSAFDTSPKRSLDLETLCSSAGMRPGPAARAIGACERKGWMRQSRFRAWQRTADGNKSLAASLMALG